MECVRHVDPQRQRAARCSFCGAPEEESGSLVAGPYLHICAGCVDVCNTALEAARRLPAEQRSRLSRLNKEAALPSRRWVEENELLERVVEEYRDERHTDAELHAIASQALAQAAAEFLYGDHFPFQLYARERIRRTLDRAMAE